MNKGLWEDDFSNAYFSTKGGSKRATLTEGFRSSYFMYAGFHKLSRARDKNDVRVNYKIMSSSENSTRRSWIKTGLMLRPLVMGAL
jgi:hypothetical protein